MRIFDFLRLFGHVLAGKGLGWQRIIGFVIVLLGLWVVEQPVLYAAPPPPTSPTIAGQVERLSAEATGRVTISVHPTTGAVRFVQVTEQGDLAPAFIYDQQRPRATQLVAKSASFLARYGSLFGLTDPATELQLTTVQTDTLVFTDLTYMQSNGGVPVFGGILRTHFDATGKLTAVNGVAVPVAGVNTTPSIQTTAAEAVALAALQSSSQVDDPLQIIATQLYIVQPELLKSASGPLYLAYQIEIANRTYTVRRFVFVEAHTGKVLFTLNGIHELEREVSEGSLNNKVWDEGNGNPEPIPAGWASGSTAQVNAWNEELAGAKEAYNLFGSLTNGAWLSYDGQEATMRTVNNDPQISCPNANWNSVSTNYCNGVTGDDTVAHEWVHAYTEYTSNLLYAWQAGALNESYSDIWGEVVDLLNGRGTDSPLSLRTAGSCSTLGTGAPANDTSYRWLSGEDDLAFGGAIRDMWNPVCYGDPGKVTDTQYTCDVTLADDGGVHTNSGVPNHLFALLVDGGIYNNTTVNAIGLTRAAHLYWRAQRAYLTPVSDFSDHAAALTAACTDLIGQPLYALTTAGPASWGTVAPETITVAHCTAVAAAITAVELRTPPSKCNLTPLLAPNAPALCAAPTVPTTFYQQSWENGLDHWTVGRRALLHPNQFTIPDWSVVTDLPDGRSGSGAFGPDPIYNGDNCQTLDESGVVYLQSPPLTVPTYATTPRLAFDHWLATEVGWDGGNLKIRVNGGGWTTVAATALRFNSYNATLNTLNNTNPLAGEPAFTGSNHSSAKGSWGQTQVDLSSYARPGDQIELRFELGLDGCNGLVGWYVDDVHAYACTAPSDVTISKTAIPSTALPGQPVTFQLTLGNANATPASGVVVTDILPAGLIVSSFSTGGALITTPSPRLVWSLASLDAGQPKVMTVTAVISPALVVDLAVANSAVVTANNEANPANNTATSTVDVTVPCIGFATDTQRAMESAGQVPLTLTLSVPNPYAAVHVTYATIPGSAAAGMDYTGVNSTMSIAPGATTAVLLISLINDAVPEGEETFQVVLTATAGAQVTQQTVTITLEDEDRPGLTIQPLSSHTGEDGTTASIQVALTAQPSAPVTVTFTSSNLAEGSVTASLFFTPQTWQTPQMITVSGVDDAIDDGDIPYQISATLTSADPAFAAVAPVAVMLTNLDNEVARLTVVKTVTAPSVAIGSALTYHYAITNSGNVALNQVSAVDDRLGAVPLSVTSLPPNSSVHSQLTHTITITDLPVLMNTVTATGVSIGGNLVTGQAQAQVKLLDVDLALSKTVGIEGLLPACAVTGTLNVPLGTTVRYCYRVTNRGSYPLTSHQLVDDRLGILLQATAVTLAPGATYSTSITATLSVSTTNVATWTSSFLYTTPVTAATVVSKVLEISATDAVTVTVAAATADSDGDTIPDNVEGAMDMDSDNLPNFLDTDADNDGISDQEEAGPDPLHPRDSNNNGVPDYLEAGGGIGTAKQLFLPLVFQ